MLYLLYKCSKLVYDHDLKDCDRRKESTLATEMVRFLEGIDLISLEGSGQCTTCGCPQEICRLAKDGKRSSSKEGCFRGTRMRNGIAVILVVQDSVLREILFPIICVEQPNIRSKRICKWMGEQVDFWVIKVPRLVLIFQKPADGYDGITRKVHSRAVRRDVMMVYRLLNQAEAKRIMVRSVPKKALFTYVIGSYGGASADRAAQHAHCTSCVIILSPSFTAQRGVKQSYPPHASAASISILLFNTLASETARARRCWTATWLVYWPGWVVPTS